MSIFMETLKGKKNTTVPIWFMRQAGRYLPEYKEVRSKINNFLELCYNPKLASEVTLQPIRRFGFDAAIIFSDILVIPHAMGLDVVFKEGEGPHIYSSDKQKENLGFDADKITKNLSKVYQAIELTCSKLDENTPLIGFCGAPWTIACYIIEGKPSRDWVIIKQMTHENYILIKHIIDELVKAIILHAINQIKAGCKAIQLFDSWAGSVPEDKLEELVMNPLSDIVKGIKKEFPDVPIIGFPMGIGENYKIYSEKSGVDAISIDHMIDMNWAVKNIKNKTLQGNLNPETLLGSKDNIYKEVMNILEVTKDIPHIFNLGHGILKETPIENVSYVIDIVRNF